MAEFCLEFKKGICALGDHVVVWTPMHFSSGI